MSDMDRRALLRHLTPSLPKCSLQLMAGLMWALVGLMLSRFAWQWLQKSSDWQFTLSLLFGLILAILINRLGFSKVAKANIMRINAYMKQRVCLFAFQKWSTYPLIAIMVSFGIYLRKYSSLPRPLLAVLYLGIGGSLLLASRHYFVMVFRTSAACRGADSDPMM